MKMGFLAVIYCCILQLQLASAQSAEIKQLALNIEKLSQLKQMLSDMKKGYEVVSKGYNNIKNISQGNFTLHELFLDGLLAVNPELRKYRKVKDIISYQLMLVNQYKSAFNWFKSTGRFSPEEILYLSKVYANLFDSSIQNLDELTMVITASQLRMSDDERLKAIDRLYDEVREKVSFLQNFNAQVSKVELSRNAVFKETRILKGMHK